MPTATEPAIATTFIRVGGSHPQSVTGCHCSAAGFASPNIKVHLSRLSPAAGTTVDFWTSQLDGEACEAADVSAHRHRWTPKNRNEIGFSAPCCVSPARRILAFCRRRRWSDLRNPSTAASQEKRSARIYAQTTSWPVFESALLFHVRDQPREAFLDPGLFWTILKRCQSSNSTSAVRSQAWTPRLDSLVSSQASAFLRFFVTPTRHGKPNRSTSICSSHAGSSAYICRPRS